MGPWKNIRSKTFLALPKSLPREAGLGVRNGALLSRSGHNPATRGAPASRRSARELPLTPAVRSPDPLTSPGAVHEWPATPASARSLYPRTKGPALPRVWGSLLGCGLSAVPVQGSGNALIEWSRRHRVAQGLRNLESSTRNRWSHWYSISRIPRIMGLNQPMTVTSRCGAAWIFGSRPAAR